MKKFSNYLIKKIYLQNSIINYFSYNFKYVLFFDQFNGNTNTLNFLKENSLNIKNTSLSLIYKNLDKIINTNNKNRFQLIKNLFSNKGIRMIKFENLNELMYFFNMNRLLNSNFIIGGLVEGNFWTFNDLKILKERFPVEINLLKFNFYYKSFSSILHFIQLLNNISLNLKK